MLIAAGAYIILYCNDVHACVDNARTGYTVFCVPYICFDLVRKPSHIMVMYLLHQLFMQIATLEKFITMQMLGFVGLYYSIMYCWCKILCYWLCCVHGVVSWWCIVCIH